jgi:hypothetical protein
MKLNLYSLARTIKLVAVISDAMRILVATRLTTTETLQREWSTVTKVAKVYVLI